MVKGIPNVGCGPEEALSNAPIKQPKAKVIQMNVAAKEEGFSGSRFAEISPFVEGVSGDAEVLEITNFPKEMVGCIELEEELDRYFQFLSNLSRDELLAIVKYEVYNRVLMQQDFGENR